MRRKAWLLIPVGAMFLLTLLGTASWVQGEVKIGSVDFMTLFDNYAKTKVAYEQQKKEDEVVRTEIERRRGELDELKKKLRSGVLKEEEQKKLREEIEAKDNNLRNFILSAREDSTQNWKAKVEGLIKEIRQVISDYAKKNGYTLILEKRSILYELESMDITKEILKVLNQEKTNE